MAASNKKICLLFLTIYSFFICFLLVLLTLSQNVFGWTLSYQQLIYEWKVLNLHEARRTVFNYALLHFGIFALCCLYYLRKATNKRSKNNFSPLKGT